MQEKDSLSKTNDQNRISFVSHFPDAPQTPGKSTHASMLISELKNTKLIDYLTQLYSDIKNLKILKWSLTPGTLKITNEMFGHMMEQLNSMHVRIKN